MYVEYSPRAVLLEFGLLPHLPFPNFLKCQPLLASPGRKGLGGKSLFSASIGIGQ